MKNNYLQMKWAVRAALLALLLSAMGVTNAKAEEYFTVNNLNFVIDENGDVTLLGHVLGQGAYGELLIPDSVEYWGYEWPVIAIADHAFEESGIDGHLDIPNTVVSIGDYAFAYCGGLKDVLVLGNAVTSIGISAFEGCDSFTCQLVLPDHLITIGDYAFSGCNGFTGSISIPNTVTTIGAFAFAMCTFSGDLILPNSVTSIGVGAFYDDIFSGTLTLSSNLMVIPDEAFAGWSGFMGNRVIPGSVVEIGEYAFAGCSGFTGELVLSNVLHVIGDDAFTGCSGFTGDLVIPNSVNTMGEKAFDDCSGFNGSLNIPNYVSQIAYKTFNGCSGFTGDLVIPNEVTDINDYAFAGCSGFSGALSLPYYLTAVGEQAFANCNGLSSIISQAEEPPMLNATAFVDVDIDIPVYIPCGTRDAYQNAMGWSNFTNYHEDCVTFEVYVEVVGEGTVSGAGTYNFGDICTLTATPNPGYVFDHWVHSTGEVIEDNPYVFTVTANVYVEAFFVVGNVSHEYVDLGLPSGTLWATCNVGATTPEAYGDYFAWGETTPKDIYSGDTYTYSDNPEILPSDHDAATTNWGSDWRMPTQAEFQELLDNTTVTWTQQNGVYGRLFTGSNGNSLFLPAAGCRSNSSLYSAGSYGYYWSSSLNTDNPSNAWLLSFNSGNFSMYNNSRYVGRSVRPVLASSGPIEGDANGDGEMNALDIVIIVNYIFGETPDVFFFDNADVNGDGEINALDIVAIINLIFSK